MWLKKLISESITYNIEGNFCLLTSPTLDSTNYPITWPNISSLWCLLFQQISCLEEFEITEFSEDSNVSLSVKETARSINIFRLSVAELKLFVQPVLL